MTLAIKRAILLKTVSDGIARFSALLYVPMILHFIGASGLGAFSQVNTVANMILPFASLGLGASLGRYLPAVALSSATQGKLRRVLVLFLLSAVACSGIIALCAGPLSRLFLNWPEGERLFQAGAFLILAGAMENAALEMLRARCRFVRYCAFQSGSALLMLLAATLLFYTGRGIIHLVVAIILIKILLSLLAAWPLLAHPADAEEKTPGVGQELPMTKDMISFGLSMSIAGVGLWMVNSGDRLVIGHYLPAADLGIYSAIFSFSSLLVAFNTPMNFVVYPHLVRAVSDNDQGQAISLGRMAFRYVNMVLIPAALFIALFLNPFLAAVGGKAPSIPLYLTLPIILAVLMSQWNAFSEYVLLSCGNVHWIRNTWLIMGILNMTANIVLVPRLGLAGAAGINISTFAVIFLVFFCRARQCLPLADAINRRNGLLSFVGAGIAGLVAYMLIMTLPRSIPSLCIAAACFAGSYVLWLAVTGEVGKADWMELRSVLTSFVS